MIGRALNHEQMTKVIRNLTGLEQPWNCPHGRPTMRFMADLPPLRADDAAAEEQLWQADAEQAAAAADVAAGGADDAPPGAVAMAE